jgi:branched-chain amino acid transport system permease protein
LLGWLNVEGLAVVGNKFNDVSGLDIEVPKYQFGIYGIIIVLVMLFRPTGIIPERRRKREFQEIAQEQEDAVVGTHV